MQNLNGRHTEVPPNESERLGCMSDRECLDAYIHHGDRDALGELVYRYRSLVFRVCYRCLNHREDALDATQEVFLKLCKNAHRIERELGGWLASCSSNTAISYIRSESSRRRREGGYDPADVVDWIDLVEHEDTAHAVHQCLSSMPANDRELLELHLIDGLSQATIAKGMGVSQQAISKRIAHLKDLFRQNLIKRGIASLVAAIASSIPGKAIQAAISEVCVVVAAIMSSKSTAFLTLGLAAISMPPEQSGQLSIGEYAKDAPTTDDDHVAIGSSIEHSYLNHSYVTYQGPMWTPAQDNKVGLRQYAQSLHANSYAHQAPRFDYWKSVSADANPVVQGSFPSDSAHDDLPPLSSVSNAEPATLLLNSAQARRIVQSERFQHAEEVMSSTASVLWGKRSIDNHPNAVLWARSGEHELPWTVLPKPGFPTRLFAPPGVFRYADLKRTEVSPGYPRNENLSPDWVVGSLAATTHSMKRTWFQAIVNPEFDIREHRIGDLHMQMKARHSLAVLSAIAAFPISAGVTVDNGDQAGYDALINQASYSSVGFIDWSGGLASGVYIGDGWVLTAAHVAEAASTFDFTINDTIYTSSEVYTYASWDGSAANGNDIALIQLGTDVEGVSPALLYDPGSGDGSELLGSVATYTGYGKTGDGSSGATGSAGTFVGGQNLIESFGGTTFLRGYSDSVFFSDFDNPDNTFDGLPWSENTALDYEYLIASGDSGGGVFIESDGQEYLVGINSFVLALDGDPNSDYGDISGATYIPDYYDWILGLTGLEAGSLSASPSIPEPSSLAVLVMAGAFVARRRRQH